MRIKNQKIEYRLITELKPYERNTRTHSKNQIGQIVRSIKAFGWTNPVLIDEQNNIIAGHARVEAARKMLIAEIPCIVLDELTPAQKKAYAIADNKLALNAGWNEDLLSMEFADLRDMDFDLELTGFELDEIADLVVEDKQNDNEPANNSEINSQYLIMIECDDEKHQADLLDRFAKDNLKCRALIS